MSPSPIDRPIATALLTCGVVLTGIAGYPLLPLATLPQVDFPSISVDTTLPGASAETMAATVAAPLEQQFQTIPGLTEMTSRSTLGDTSITLQFDLDRSIDAAAQDVQTAINAAGGLLPKTLQTPPTYHKVNPAAFKVLTIALTSDSLPLRVVDEYANTYLVRPISQIKGVGVVDLNGEQKPAIRVQVNPVAVASLGLTLEDVRAAIQTATVDGPKGTLSDAQRSVTLDANDQLLDAQSANDLIIAYHSGAPVRIRDIGRAISAAENVRIAAWYQRHHAILIDVHPQPGANLVDSIDRIKAALPDLRRQLPPAIAMAVVGDRSLTVRASIADMKFTLALTIGLVVMVIFLFLRRFWATLIPSLAIPASLIGACGTMYLLSYSLDNLSFMALTIAVGFVVDDAIVMIENITRHVEAGMSPMAAASQGAREITFTIISMTVSLVAVFIPLLFMGGMLGRLFREFAVTVAVALAVSAIVSLTLIPMMCGRLIHRAQVENENRLGRWSAQAIDRMLATYRVSLAWALAHASFMLAVAVAFLIATVWLFVIIPKGFIPQQDVGIIAGATESAADTSFAAMAARQEALVERILTDPEVDAVSAFTDPSPFNQGRIYIYLKPFAQRRTSVDSVIQRLRSKAAEVRGMSLAMQAVQDVQIGGHLTQLLYQYTLEDPNLSELYQWGPRLKSELARLPELQDVQSDLQATAPHAGIVIDRDTASRFGITAQAIDDTLYDAFGQRQVATLFTQLDQFHIVLEVDPSFQLDTDALSRLYLRSSSGQLVPLSAFTHVGRSVAPIAVNHQGQFPAVTLSFSLAPGISLGQALRAVATARARIGMPPSVHASFQGTAQAFQASLGSEPYLILAAILAVYIVLGVLYESLVHPITILSTLPSAGVGALVALTLTGNDLNVMSLVGMILLIGIVKKNAIMMIDFAITAQKSSERSAAEAIYEAAVLRFRPITMTTLTALLGSLPLALGVGPGSELRRPLGIAIVGGLLVSQLLTLYTTPVIFLFYGEGSPRDVRHASKIFRRAPWGHLMAKVLVIEDDAETAEQIVAELSGHGFTVDREAVGGAGLERASTGNYDVITLDRRLPGLDGLTIVERLRQLGVKTPVLLLSALGEVEDRVRGLRAGGDDYLTKPFAFAELNARIDALLRRSPEPRATLLRIGDLELDLLAQEARRGTRNLDLQPRELRLLEHLVRHHGQVVTRAMLFEQVWHYHFDPRTNLIDVHIGRLRRKVDLPGEAPLIHTIRGVGFVLRAPV